MSHPTVSSEDLIFRKVSVESCKDSMPNFASEPHPGFKSVKKVQSLNYVFKNWKTNYILQWGVGVHYLKVFWHPDSEHVAAAYQFDHHFFVWHDVTTDGRKMLICYPATGRCCAPPKSIDIKTNHFEHPATPPPFALSFLCGVWFTLPLTILPQENPHLWWTRKHLIPTVSTPSPPSHRCDLDANGAASPSPASARCFAATPPRVRFGGAAQKAQPLGRNWGRKDDGGVGKKWFRMPGIFPYKNEEPLQWRSDDNLFLSWFQVCWLIFFFKC